MERRCTRPSRRSILAGTFLALAGCLGDESVDDEEPSGTDREGPFVNGFELSYSFPLVLNEYESGDIVADVHWHDEDISHWHRAPLTVPLDGERSLAAVVTAADGEELDLGADEDYEIGGTVTPEELLDVTIDGNHVMLTGEQEGEGELHFEVREPGSSGWVTPELPVEVTPQE